MWFSGYFGTHPRLVVNGCRVHIGQTWDLSQMKFKFWDLIEQVIQLLGVS